MKSFWKKLLADKRSSFSCLRLSVYEWNLLNYLFLGYGRVLDSKKMFGAYSQVLTASKVIFLVLNQQQTKSVSQCSYKYTLKGLTVKEKSFKR